MDIPWCEGDLFSIEKLALAFGLDFTVRVFESPSGGESPRSSEP